MPGDFQFLDPGPLIDQELELVAPQERWVEDVLAACAHPLSRLLAPLDAQVTRQHLLRFLSAAPGGREPADGAHSHIPQYHFWMRLRDPFVGAMGSAPIRMLGGIGLRVGTTPSIEMYYGHFGYHVHPPARGRHYALRACRLLLPLIRRHRLSPLWITCNPDNFASRSTCERLGARLVAIVSVPESESLYARGERFKCRYRLEC